MVEPDIAVICDQTKLDRQGCIGAPDLIIEVISPSAGRKDRLEKFNKYEQAGVREFWVVEPEEKLISVFMLGENRRYGRPEIYTEGDQINVGLFPGLTIDLETIFT